MKEPIGIKSIENAPAYRYCCKCRGSNPLSNVYKASIRVAIDPRKEGERGVICFNRWAAS